MPKWLADFLDWLLPKPAPQPVPIPVRTRPRHNPRAPEEFMERMERLERLVVRIYTIGR